MEKRKQLEAAGWKSATVQEFLKLDNADMAYIETKLALSRRLRQLLPRALNSLHIDRSNLGMLSARKGLRALPKPILPG